MRHETHERFVQAVIARSGFYDEAIQETASLAPPFWIASCRALLTATAGCARNDNV
jgi:hypothetical protein